MEQNCKFKKAVYIGDTLTAWVTLIDIVNKEKGIVNKAMVDKNLNHKNFRYDLKVS